jgi:hypothetical protein
MGTIISGTNTNYRREGGGGSTPSPSTDKIDVGSSRLSLSNSDFTVNNIMENLDFSNLEYTDFLSIKQLELVEGISTDSPDFFELYYDALKYNGSIGICEHCFIKYKDLIDKLFEINLSKIKDISNLFKGAQVIIDDPSDIQRLERGSPLLSNFASNYLNNDSAKIVGNTFDDCIFYIVSKTSTINEITVVDDINISSNVKMLKGMIYLLGRISVVRLPELTIEGVTQVTPVRVKYSDINILNMNKDQDNIIQLSSNKAPIQEIGDLTGDIEDVMDLVSGTVVKIGNLNVPGFENKPNVFLGKVSLMEVGKFPMILGSLDISQTSFNTQTLEKLFNDTVNQGMQKLLGGESATIYVNSYINNSFTQEQKDNIRALGYKITVKS